jgi:hypothetical protein
VRCCEEVSDLAGVDLAEMPPGFGLLGHT